MTTFQRRGAWALFSLLGLLVLGALLFRLGAGWYLQSDHFRKQITGAADHALQAEGDFMPLHYADGTFYTDGYVARGKPSAFFSDLRAEQIRSVVNWRALLDHRYEVDELSVQNLDVRFAARPPVSEPVATQPQPKKKSAWKLDLRRAEIAQSAWHWGATPAAGGSVTGAAFTLLPNDGGWLIDASSGTLAQSGWPSLTIASAKLRYTGNSLFITESELQNGAGRIGVSGEIRFNRAADLQANFANISVTSLLPPDWRVRLHGNISGTAHLTAPLPDGDLKIATDLRLTEGQLEALPLLNQIATFTQTERFRRIDITRGSLSFTREKGVVTITKLLLESEGLLRVEGNCTIANEKIDGRFQVGVTAASLQWLPGSQARVFTVAHDGYYWTPVHLTGPVAHPHEDLSRRLAAAAAGELLQKSSGDLLDSAKSLLDLIPH